MKKVNHNAKMKVVLDLVCKHLESKYKGITVKYTLEKFTITGPDKMITKAAAEIQEMLDYAQNKKL